MLKVNKNMVLGLLFLTTSLFSIALLRTSATPVSAATPGDVIINELMYNPATGDQNDEYIELFNTTGSPIDISSWSFSAGITCVFPPGTTIGANDYVIVSPYIFLTLATYGVTNSCNYISTGTNLSNGGETVTLVDDSAQVINSVTYDDISPWPASPDGTGPSLELKATGLDNSLPASWGAGINSGGTPLAQNSLVGLTLPEIANVTDPNNVTDSQDIDITAEVTDPGAPTVVLKYKLNFDADVTLTMYDDGAHNDGTASDNVYGAQIPAQAQQTLVRFKVEATNGSGTASNPSVDDSMEYHGYYIKDPGVTADVPIVEWFISDATYDDLHTNHVGDNVYLDCVVVLGDEVYDSSLVRIKGEISRGFPKKSYKFKLPSGYKIDIPGGSSRTINEFHMNSEYHTGTMGHTLSAWWVIQNSGIPIPDMIVTRVQKNGEYEGLYTYAEKYEKEWRDEHGYNNGELFEDASDIHSGANSFASMISWEQNLNLDDQDPVKRDYVLDNNNIPAIFNYMSAKTILSSWDHFIATNTFSYKDDATGRWSHLYWDLSSAFSMDYNRSVYPSPYDNSSGQNTTRISEYSVYGQKDLRALYFRRLRTLADKFYSGDQLDAKFQELEDLYQDEMALDLVKWPEQEGYTRNLNNYAGGVDNTLVEIKRNLLVLHRQPWALPGAQTQQERESVSLDEIVADSNNANEYIKLSNTANTAVDISDWYIEGIDYSIPAGSVIPANGSIYILRDDVGYRASHAAVLVAGQYTNDLGSSGTQILKTETGDVIDTESY